MDIPTLDRDSSSSDRPGADPDPRPATGALGRLADLARGWGLGVRPSRSAVVDPGVALAYDDDRTYYAVPPFIPYRRPTGSALRADNDPDGGICQW